MNKRFLRIIIFLLNLYLVFSEFTLEKQCNDIKEFMKENKIPIPTNNNCCYEVANNPPYLKTNCKNNKIINFIVHMNDNEKADLNFSHFPELPELDSLTLININFKNTLPEILKRIKNKNSSGFALIIRNSNLDDLSIPSKINVREISVRGTKFNRITEIPSSLNKIDIINSEKNFDVKLLKNVKTLNILDNPIDYTLFESITKELKQLENLAIRNCEIDKIPLTINNLINLKHLDISQNRIDILPEELFDLKKLESIFIGENEKNLYGDFKFSYKLYCKINTNFLCIQNLNKQPCNDTENIITKQCTEEDFNTYNMMKKRIYNINDDNINCESNGNNNCENDKPNKQSKNPTNLPIYIALIIALVLIIAFAIFFFKYKYNKQDPIIIKDDDNNATYAYKMSDKSKQIVKEFQLNKEKEDKEQNVETITNTRNSNVSLDVNSLEMNNNVINSSDNNVQTTHASQIIGNTSYENINNLSGNNSFINVNNNLSPQNIIYGFNGASSSIPVIINNFSNENMDEAPPYTVTSSVVESKQILQDANDYMDKEELRLQAKIQNEMLATQESLLEKKIKEDKYNDDRKFDGDEPPPYC